MMMTAIAITSTIGVMTTNRRAIHCNPIAVADSVPLHQVAVQAAAWRRRRRQNLKGSFIMLKTIQKSLAMGLALTLAAAPLALAQPAPYDHNGPPQQHGGYQPDHQDHQDHHDWQRGARFDGDRQPVHDWRERHLRQPPHGYEWERSGNQFVLIAIGTGIIASVIAGSLSQ